MSNDPNRESYLRIVESSSSIDGRFIDIRRIDARGGSGTFSLLFRARDTGENRDVALKFYHPDWRHDAYRWGCFQREAEILESLAGQRDIAVLIARRSEFVHTLTAGTITLQVPLAYYALELASSDMGAAIARGNLSPEELLVAFQAICRALQRLHARGISHRDLKPRNFLILPSGEVKLSDFGCARRHDGSAPQLLSSYAGPPGDLRYAAPEMFACLHDDDPAVAFGADVFSLGAILFEMFSGVQLGSLVFDPTLTNDLVLTMSTVRRGHRRQVYDGFVGSMANAHPLPDLRALGSVAPQSIIDRIDKLYKSMAALDYRARMCDFERIFLQVNTCLLVLRNEEAFRRWQEEKCKRRAATLAKQQRFGVNR